MACAELDKLKNPPEQLAGNGLGVASGSQGAAPDAPGLTMASDGGGGGAMELEELDPAQEAAQIETDDALDKARRLRFPCRIVSGMTGWRRLVGNPERDARSIRRQ